jgi:hypothetical protein
LQRLAKLKNFRQLFPEIKVGNLSGKLDDFDVTAEHITFSDVGNCSGYV